VRGPTPFIENGTLKAIRPFGVAPLATTSVQLFYGDEHALTLGSSRLGTQTCTVEPTPAAPACRDHPQIGCVDVTDPAGRPLWPALFITDLTANGPNSRAGDWQCGGQPFQPTSVCGVWKMFDPTLKNGGSVDPPANHQNLGAGADPYPPLPDSTCNCTGIQHCTCNAENYGAEVRWDIATLVSQGMLLPGHSYRLQVMVHDGDQNQVGGDVGQQCVNVRIPN
jgi:hypothetical protein